MALETPCDFAKARYVEIGLLRKRWGLLILILGIAVTISVAASILLFLRAIWITGAITSLNTIVNGAAMTWLTKQQRTAMDDDKKAFDDLVQTCGSPYTYVAEHGSKPTLSHLMTLHSFDFSLPGSMETAPWFQELEAARQSEAAGRKLIASLRAGSSRSVTT